MSSQSLNNCTDQDDSNVLPVDKQKIKGTFKRVVMVVPALDEAWTVEKIFAYYVFPPSDSQNESAKNAWLLSVNYVLDDIWWLCELPYHKFWSQVIFNASTINGVKSFLQLAPLQKLYHRVEDNEILSMYKKIKKAVFQILKRISRSRESQLHFMSEEKYRDFVNNNELFSISSIFCICTIYGEKQKEDVENMLSLLFKYSSNIRLDQAVCRTLQLFSYLTKKLKESYNCLRKNIEICENIDDFQDISSAYRTCLVSTVQFLVNVAVNVSNLVSVYSPACEIFSNYNFEYHIVRVYKKLLIPIYQETNIIFNNSHYKQSHQRLLSMLDITRSEFMNTFTVCLNSSLNILKSGRQSHDIIQKYVKLMKFSVTVKEFILDFSSINNISEITANIKEAISYSIDVTEIDRLCDTINEFCNNFENSNVKKCNSVGRETDKMNMIEKDENILHLDLSSDNDTTDTDDEVSSSYSDWSKNENSDSEYEGYLASDIDEDEVPGSSSFLEFETDDKSQIAITQIKDIFPDLGNRFILMCLKHYKMDITAVINAILENNLPVELKKLESEITHISSDVIEKIENQNVDTNSKTKSDLKEFKKTTYTSYEEMFNDKDAVETVRNIYEKYKNVTDNTEYNDDVEEEFDEQYVGTLEADPEELYDSLYKKSRQSERNEIYFVPYEMTNLKNVECDRDKSEDFCENPEEVRAKLEQRKQAMNRNRSFVQSFKNHCTKNRLENKNNRYHNTNKHFKDDYRSRKNVEYEKFDNFKRRDKHNVDCRNPDSRENRNNNEKYFASDLKTDNYNENSSRDENDIRSKNANVAQYKDRQELNRNNLDRDICNREKDQRWHSDQKSNKEIDRRQNKNFKSEYYYNKNRTREKYHNERDYSNYNNFNRDKHLSDTQKREDQPNYPRESHDANADEENYCNNTGRERYYKNIHKSKNANHNRKFLSDRKRRF